MLRVFFIAKHGRDVIDVNIVKVPDKYIGPAVPVVQK